MKSSNSPHQGFWRAPLKSDWIWIGNWWKKCLKVLLWRRNLTDRNWKSHDFLPKYYIETHWSNSLNFYRIQSNLHGGEECDGKDVDFHEKRGRMRNTSKAAAEHVVRILDELFMKKKHKYIWFSLDSSLEDARSNLGKKIGRRQKIRKMMIQGKSKQQQQ